MPTTQIVISIENSMLTKVDDLGASGAMDDRAEVVRTAVSLLLHQCELTPTEDAAAEASWKTAILDERW